MADRGWYGGVSLLGQSFVTLEGFNVATIFKQKRKNGITYCATVHIKGEPQTKTFESKSEAEVWAKHVEDNVERLKEVMKLSNPESRGT